MSLGALLASASDPSSLNDRELDDVLQSLCDEVDRISVDPPEASTASIARMASLMAVLEEASTERKNRKKGLVASAPRGGVGGGLIPRMAATSGLAHASPTAHPRRPMASPVTITAASAAANVPAGSPLTSSEQLGQVMSEALRALAPDGSAQRRRRLVAMARWEYPEDRKLGADPDENTRRIDAVCGLNAGRYDERGTLVASGGICLPVNVDYSVPTWSTADRPLRDGLPSFQATRGGIQFVQPPDIGVPSLQATASGAGESVAVWTEATDADPAGATKPVWVVACGSEETAYVNAVPTRVQFGNMQSRFAPEQVAANTQQAIAVSAREAELELLTTIANSTVQVAPAQYLGATRDLLATVDLLKAQYIYSHRFSPNVAITVIFPAWVQDMIRADMAREVAHDNSGSINVLAITDAQIDDWFSVRGINVIWTLDALKAGTYARSGGGSTSIPNQFFPLASVGENPVWPNQTANVGSPPASTFTLAWFMFVEGTFQFLDGGRLDLGVVRDSLLDSTNDYETFVEVFENLAYRGIEAYQVQSPLRVTGGSAGTVAVSSYLE